MAHIRSQDPFDFVGKHVIRGLPRAPHKKEHGWITRYDAEIDCYWLFVPGGGPPRRLPRAEVIKFVSNPRIEMRDDDQDAFPPPVEDTTSRFVGVPVLKRAAGASSRRRKAQAPVAGEVVCFLPFADLYRVQYADGSTEELGESAIVDGMIEQLKARPETATPPEVIDVDVLDTKIAGKKRPRADKPPPPEFKETSEPSSSSLGSANRQVETQGPVAANVSSKPSEKGVADQGGEVDDGGYESEEDEEMPEYSPPPPSSEGPVSILELDDAMTDFIPVDEDETSAGGEAFSVLEAGGNTAQPSSPRSPSKLPFYIVEDVTHSPTSPLDRRSTAFEYLRQWVLNLLDRQEAGNRKNLQQYDVLRNSDIKDRDAIRRFIDAEGLYVLNDLLAAFINADTDEGDDDLYFVLKVVAMLPLPSYAQVVESRIGKTINVVARSSVPKDRWRPIPKCVTQLAKWIRNRWCANIKEPTKEPKRPKPAPLAHTARPSRPMHKRRLYAPVPSSIPRGPSLMVAGTPAQNRMPMDEPRPANDPTPIPRLPRRGPVPALAVPSRPFVELAPPPPVASFAETRSMNRFRQPPPPPPPPPAQPQQRQQDPVRRGSLKPDYLRRSEERAKSRFTAQSDTSAERRHYQASQKQTKTAQAAGSSQKKEENPDNKETAGGPGGVFGRSQRLKFGKKWMRKEFDRAEPPVAVSGSDLRQPQGRWGDRWGPPDAQPFRRFPTATSVPTPQSILKRTSSYNKPLELPGMSVDAVDGEQEGKEA